MGVMQIDNHGRDGLPERRTRLQPGRSFGGRTFAATGATSAEQTHPGYVGADRRQFDADVDLLGVSESVRKVLL